MKPKLDKFIQNYLQSTDINLYYRFRRIIVETIIPAIQEKKNTPYTIQITSALDQKVLLFSLPSEADAQLINHHPMAKQIGGENFDLAWETPLFSNNSCIKFAGQNRNNNRRIRNDSKWNEIKLGVWLRDIKLMVSSFNPAITELISLCLPYVFSMENFGLRQSKGFGCFSIENQNENHLLALRNNQGISIYKMSLNSNWKHKLNYIRNFWKLLKAGQTYPYYYKSDLMKYFCMLNGTRWEKRKIKKEIFVNNPTLYASLKTNQQPNRIAGCISDRIDPENTPADQNYKYVRGLLGLAEHNEFGVANADPVKIKISNGNVDRFKSPITFKIFENEIFLICYPIPLDLSGNEANFFSFDHEISTNPYYAQNLTELAIPMNFDICHFLDSPWLGNTLNQHSNWGDYSETGVTNRIKVAAHHGFTKIT